MSRNRIAALLLATAGGFGLAAGTAHAQASVGLQLTTPQAQASSQARVSTDLRLRAGPGTSYSILTTIPSGTIVPIFVCTEGFTWCQTQYGNFTGWVSANFLVSIAPGTQGQTVGNVGAQLGIQLFSLLAGALGGNVSIGIQPGPGAQPQVCYYDQANFGGTPLCDTPGTSRPSLSSSWNNRISSIYIFGDLEVQICRDTEFWGWCEVYTSSVSQLPQNRNNAASSVRVR